MRCFFFSLFRLVLVMLALGTAVFVSPAAAQQPQPELILHYIAGTPLADRYAYDVVVYFSLLDAQGNPIRNLAIENLSAAEDNQPVRIVSLSPASEETIHVIFLLDTSGSMVGGKIAAARQAAASFIAGMKTGDQVALITFDNRPATLLRFTPDLSAARAAVNRVDAVPGAGTCFYDALRDAVELTATLPSGRRAIIALTDGRDERPSGTGPCSVSTFEDVVALASQGATRVPIYTVGLGNNLDEAGLRRLAQNTGGRYAYSPGESQLEALFRGISDQLRSQYVLHYTSAASPGPHTLALQFNSGTISLTRTRGFVLPDFPYRLEFASLPEIINPGDALPLTVAVSGHGAPIARVVFYVSGEQIGVDDSIPYTFSWDTGGLPPGVVTLEAVALAADGTELTRVSRSVEIAARSSDDSPSGTPPATSTPYSGGGASADPLLFVGLVLAGLFVLGFLIWLFLLLVRRRREAERERAWNESQKMPEDFVPPSAEVTVDSLAPSENALALLIVEQSDDPTMAGRHFEISNLPVRLGRSADNDIVFPKDSPVSRHHAIIEMRSGQLYLSEVLGVEKDGRERRPTYGTFINDQQVEAARLLLSGDRIRLGKRLVLRFEAVRRNGVDNERTIDQSGDDITRDR